MALKAFERGGRSLTSQSFSGVSSPAARERGLAVGRKGNRIRPASPHGPLKLLSTRPLATSQSFRRFVIAARERGLAVGRKGNRIDRIRIALKAFEGAAARHIPELQRVVLTARERGLAVGRKGNRVRPHSAWPNCGTISIFGFSCAQAAPARTANIAAKITPTNRNT